MAIPLFLAMTGAEMQKNGPFPPNIAWMACHFSPYGTGISNIPEVLPNGSMIILNDRTPVCGHDPERVAEQMLQLVEQFRAEAILLDFQRPDVAETAAIASRIVQQCTCPVGVTEYYAREWKCPVFLSPVPPHIPLDEYLAPWQGREIWLEAALDGTEIVVKPEGSTSTACPYPAPAEHSHWDERLHCHYEITTTSEQVRFRLYRTGENLAQLLDAAGLMGVTRAVGLYQELAQHIIAQPSHNTEHSKQIPGDCHVACGSSQ